MCLRRIILVFLSLQLVILACYPLEAKTAALSEHQVKEKMHEIMKAHAKYKKMTPQLIKRALDNFISLLDPQKSYFLQREIGQWLVPEDALANRMCAEFDKASFGQFHEIFKLMQHAIARRNKYEKQLTIATLPKNVPQNQFAKVDWCVSEEALYERLLQKRAMQAKTLETVDARFKELAIQRMMKMRLKTEEKFSSNDPKEQQQIFCTLLMKALASSLDTHTVYFTPAEASQFLVSVQQRLEGIGVQLRDDLDGFTIIKILEGGPAAISGKLHINDKIIAIDHEPIIGLDGLEIVEKIRGQEGTDVLLTIVKATMQEDKKLIETKEVCMTRSQVVMQKNRVETELEPFGDGVIALLKLHSFYQDLESSAALDLTKAFTEISSAHRVHGIILDLRGNAGGLLPQAVDVVGLFIKKGIVVSIKDGNGDVQHFRAIDRKKLWDGPLLVLVDKLSASAAEIVAQSLQDYGRAIIVGDKNTFGKGSFQVFTLTPTGCDVDPLGEYKVTRGCYYTVSGKTPQLKGVASDIEVPGLYAFDEIGEEYTKYPLENDMIEPNFEDALLDVPFYQRKYIKRLYQFDLQRKESRYESYLRLLKQNSSSRIRFDLCFQDQITRLKNHELTMPLAAVDFQQKEATNIMKDLLFLSSMSLQIAA
jgi:carboxyl-terminal processing protease